MIVKVNIYKLSDGVWCYSAWTAEGFDHSDTIGVQDDATESEAREEIRRVFADADVRRVDGTEHNCMDHVEHRTHEDGLRDSYWCKRCGKLIQVG